jgi:hypothetical protein
MLSYHPLHPRQQGKDVNWLFNISVYLLTSVSTTQDRLFAKDLIDLLGGDIYLLLMEPLQVSLFKIHDSFDTAVWLSILTEV